MSLHLHVRPSHYVPAIALSLSLIAASSLHAQLPAGGPVGQGVGAAQPQTYNPATGQSVYGNNYVPPEPKQPVIYNRNQNFGIPGVTGDNFNFGLFPGLNSNFSGFGVPSNFSASALATRFDRSDSFVATEKGNYINPQLLGNPQIYLSPYPTTNNPTTPRLLESPTANFGAYRNLVVDTNQETLFNRTLPAREGLLTGTSLNNQAAYGNSLPFRENETTPESDLYRNRSEVNASYIPEDQLTSPQQLDTQVQLRRDAPGNMTQQQKPIVVPLSYFQHLTAYREAQAHYPDTPPLQQQHKQTPEQLNDQLQVNNELNKAFRTGNTIPQPHRIPPNNLNNSNNGTTTTK